MLPLGTKGRGRSMSLGTVGLPRCSRSIPAVVGGFTAPDSDLIENTKHENLV